MAIVAHYSFFRLSVAFGYEFNEFHELEYFVIIPLNGHVLKGYDCLNGNSNWLWEMRENGGGGTQEKSERSTSLWGCVSARLKNRCQRIVNVMATKTISATINLAISIVLVTMTAICSSIVKWIVNSLNAAVDCIDHKHHRHVPFIHRAPGSYHLFVRLRVCFNCKTKIFSFDR